MGIEATAFLTFHFDLLCFADIVSRIHCSWLKSSFVVMQIPGMLDLILLFSSDGVPTLAKSQRWQTVGWSTLSVSPGTRNPCCGMLRIPTKPRSRRSKPP